MAHLSENSKRLEKTSLELTHLEQLKSSQKPNPDVFLFWFPANRSDQDGSTSTTAFETISTYCASLNEKAVICALTTPPDAARLYPYLEATKALEFKLWAAVKKSDQPALQNGALPDNHLALLVFTRYKGSLKHTKTRIQYTYCPACGKTTKDYGGKKHLYHSYGTLISDVWRDVTINAAEDIAILTDRLQDLFGIEPHQVLQVFDLRHCQELQPERQPEKPAAMPKRYHKDNQAILQSKLINGDAIESLKSLPDNSVDFCFADPPYNLQKNYSHWDDAMESIEYFKWCDEWVSELARVLKPGRTLAIINLPQWVVRHYQHLQNILDYQTWIAWDAISAPVRFIMPSHYPILCFSKGQPRPLPGLEIEANSSSDKEYLEPVEELYCVRAACISKRHRTGVKDTETLTNIWHGIHRLKHNSHRVDHPCQLPPALMRRLIALFTEPGEAVLDCFNGAGTTTLTAAQMGRVYLGIELSPQYHQLTERRHEELRQGKNPFSKNNDVPTSKNSTVERLPKQTYLVSKKVLQLDVKRIAVELGRLPDREEVKRLSKYPYEYYENYFVSWGEVCAAARTTGMSEFPPKEEIYQPQLQFSFAAQQNEPLIEVANDNYPSLMISQNAVRTIA